MVSAAIDNTFGTVWPGIMVRIGPAVHEPVRRPCRARGLEQAMAAAYEARPDDLKKLDKQREADPDWFKRGTMFGDHVPDLLRRRSLRKLAAASRTWRSSLTYLHLMPLSKMPHRDRRGTRSRTSTCDPTLGHQPRSGEPDQEPARRGHQPVPRLRDEPHRLHPRVGDEGEGRRPGVPGLLLLDDRTIPDQYDAIVRAGLPEHRAGNWVVRGVAKWVHLYPFQWVASTTATRRSSSRCSPAR